MAEEKTGMARSQERPASTYNGYLMLLIELALLFGTPTVIVGVVGLGHPEINGALVG